MGVIAMTAAQEYPVRVDASLDAPYPPFRLDQGGHEPGSSLTVPEPPQPGPAMLPALPWTAAGLLVAGITFLAGGVVLIAIPFRNASRPH
jgi:hypothetical protein